MNMLQKFRWGCIGLVSLVAGGNLLPNSCVRPKPITPVPVEEPVIKLPSEADSSTLAQDAKRLNERNPQYNLTETDLVALTRMLYFEDKFDPKLEGDIQQKKGYAAIAEVIKNRLLFDTCSQDSPVVNPSCGRDDVDTHYDGHKGLSAIIDQHMQTKDKKKIYQFTSKADFSSYFTTNSLKKGLYETSFDAQEKHQVDLAYEALVGVLDTSIAPLTQGALYYKNSQKSDAINGRKIKWDGKKAFNDTLIDCSALQNKVRKMDSAEDIECRIEREFDHDYTLSIGSHDFYTVTEDLTARREIVHADACAYVNGAYDKAMSSKRYCKKP